MQAMAEATTLFDLECTAITPDWVDPDQPLLVPHNPLHVRAHKLQVLLARLDVQAKNNPAQFNSKNYMEILNAFTEAVEAINKGKSVDEVLGSEKLAGVGHDGAASEVGDTVAPGLGAGISADNPLAG